MPSHLVCSSRLNGFSRGQSLPFREVLPSRKETCVFFVKSNQQSVIDVIVYHIYIYIYLYTLFSHPSTRIPPRKHMLTTRFFHKFFFQKRGGHTWRPKTIRDSWKILTQTEGFRVPPTKRKVSRKASWKDSWTDSLSTRLLFFLWLLLPP